MKLKMKVKSDRGSKFSNLSNWKEEAWKTQPQYKYELFHINFTSFPCTGRYEPNKLTWLPMCGFIAQLVEHRIGIAEVTGSNPVEALSFSGLFFPEIYCDDHSSPSSTTAVQIWIVSYKLHNEAKIMPESQLVKNSEQKSQGLFDWKKSWRQIIIIIIIIIVINYYYYYHYYYYYQKPIT